MFEADEPRDEFHNWRGCDSEDAKTSTYKRLKLGKEVAPGFRVGDVIEFTGPDTWENFKMGDRAFVSNIRDAENEVVVTTLDPRLLPEGHIAHGDFVNVSYIKVAIDPVTPEEEAAVIASILHSER